MIDAIVIGGGVSGLATAYGLMRNGRRVLLLERQYRTGGNVFSERIGDFLMEHGPSSMNASVPAATTLERELGIDTLRSPLGPEVRYRYLPRAGRLHSIATHPLGFLLSGYLTPGARLRLLAELLVPAKKDASEESVADFCRRRFGREFADAVIDPLLGGLRAARAGEASMQACFPALVAMEQKYGSIIRAIVAKRLAHGTMPAQRLYSWEEGVETLPRALAARLGTVIRVGMPVRRIRAVPGGYRVEAGLAAQTVRARAVIVATQPHVAAELIDHLDPDAAAAAAGIDAPPLAVVFTGYRRRQIAHPLTGLGYLAPERERRALLGALFCSTMFSGRASTGHVALAAYIGGARAPDLARAAPADLVDVTRREFRELLGVTGPPVVSRVRQWARGLPQYRMGHQGRIEALLAGEQRHPGLFLTGNYFSGPSVAACIAQAVETTSRIDRYLSRPGHVCGAEGGPRASSAVIG
ncbi:MAG: protoporphyrinogen oxidase [Gammaproteobacteria bacterium]|nr:protoporphyrinogen oxidase [Gammaproteobacteria bacterium]